MQEDILNKIMNKLDLLEVAIDSMSEQKHNAKKAIQDLEQQLSAAEKLHSSTVDRINSVVTMIDEDTSYE